MTIAVKDKFLGVSERETLFNDIIANKDSLIGNYQFIDKKLEECSSDGDFFEKCISYASKYFNLSEMVGYELWYNFGSKNFKWHVDRDEVLFQETGDIKTPLCTIVYYVHLEKDHGGKLLFRNFEVADLQPKTNRIVCFNPGVEHTVEECKFERLSISICPWNYRVKKWNGISKNDSEETEENIKETKRECDGCTECCKGWLSGSAHGKRFYPGNPCHFVGEKGCSIYRNRPYEPCVTYRCGWLRDKELFPEWMKPNVAKIIATPRVTKSGVEYYEIRECGQKIDASILNHLILTALQGKTNFNIQIGGGESNYGSPQFLRDMTG